ncbi:MULTISPECIES: hypothetical protein [unclassified Rhodococcus (in: high G+C Gram-positive bacteria)]|uniref:hypothetical protein n=1 Tax=unclassified Rhodococcus (in: high G+C Gram-positive bacteria) TaxID=192944 RepID=UPI0015C65551|nr:MULTISPECIES: hypothetical protein [unclassified Rhodococcus (in: high G+C Gram-positive bacteria)]
MEQVASAAGTSEEFPVLRGVLVEVDLMLDIAAPDHPVLVRSAVDGALTTLVMPVLG